MILDLINTKQSSIALYHLLNIEHVEVIKSHIPRFEYFVPAGTYLLASPDCLFLMFVRASSPTPTAKGEAWCAYSPLMYLVCDCLQRP